MASSNTRLDVKFFVDKVKNRVLFAEVGYDFVDILFSFLTLPLGTIVRLIGDAQSLGCFSTFYQSVMSLGDEHFSNKVFKDMLLHPRNSSEDRCGDLKINVDDTKALFFYCPNVCCTSPRYKFVSIYKLTGCPYCHSRLTWLRRYFSADFVLSSSLNVFVTEALKFIITDDLQVTPAVPETVIGVLKSLGFNDTSEIEERSAQLGFKEFLELLRLTLLSSAPLTNLFISKQLLHDISMPKKQALNKKKPVGDRSGEDRRIEIKAVLLKSSKTFLFAEARRDFTDFLFSLLLIPLGQLLHIMDGQSCLGSVDSLYKSALCLDSHYYVSADHKNILLRPKLYPHFNCENHLFTLESTPASIYSGPSMRTMPVDCTLNKDERSKGFLREGAMLYVYDNLAFEPFSAANAISIYKKINVPFSDLEERTLSIGIEEGINFLRAALNSPSSAFTDGLLRNNLIFKEPKQEK